MTEEEHDAKLRAEAQALREEVAEYEALCNRQAELLSQSIVAIRGPEPELTRWGLRARVVVVPDVTGYWDGLYPAQLRAPHGGPVGFYTIPMVRTDELARLNGMTVSVSALDTLRKAALGEVQHLNNGLCPDAFEGHEARDPDCPVCRALIETGKESDNV
ncbi:hypothetical protein [Pseudomonas aeruginosa]|uniref:hypothetical protein n=1 Tax=Pseudomonas aeruginosa TaxID=287 RepID=UPI00123F5F81|nr:hypothetical protein [Pseudomonas aeruginosa]HBN9276941.1 hypothetical protein [Pseudomonas aeruginosa]HBN9452283.1 hypothetical protein [Pseudomonas aeruginosa]